MYVAFELTKEQKSFDKLTGQKQHYILAQGRSHICLTSDDPSSCYLTVFQTLGLILNKVIVREECWYYLTTVSQVNLKRSTFSIPCLARCCCTENPAKMNSIK